MEEQVQSALKRKGDIFSLDQPVGDSDTDGKTWLEDLVEKERENYPDDRLDDIVTREYGEKLLSYLKESERKVLQWRCGFMNGKVNTLNYIGNKLDISRESARQIEAQALRRLRMLFSAGAFEDEETFN